MVSNVFDIILSSPKLFILLFILMFGNLIIYCSYLERKKKKIIEAMEENIESLRSGTLIQSEEFEILHKSISPYDKRQTAFSMFDFIGVYVIHNISKQKFLVGKSQKALTRAWNVLDGRGNRFLYKDYSDGDDFELRFLDLYSSDFDTLDQLKKFEKNNISADFKPNFY